MSHPVRRQSAGQDHVVQQNRPPDGDCESHIFADKGIFMGPDPRAAEALAPLRVSAD
jgi:hypothetical protein